MKRLTVMVVVLLALNVFVVNLSFGYEWEKTFGGNDDYDYYGSSVRQTTDGGYIIAGTAASRSTDKSDVYLVKTDPSGVEVWNKSYGGNGKYSGNSVQQTVEGGYIVVGGTGSGMGSSIYLLKIDAEGNEIWSHTFNSAEFGDHGPSATGNDVQQTADGGYIIIGSVRSVSSWVLLIKTDADGNKIWWKTFMNAAGNFGNVNEGRSVQQTADGGYIIAGSITSSPGMSPPSFGYIIKTDASGNELWSKVYGDPGNPGVADNVTEALSAQQTTSGDYIIAGYTFRKVHLIKMAADGNELWSKTFGEGEGFSVQQTSDGGYFIAGDYTDPDTQITDMYLIKTDTEGIEEWSDIIDNEGKEDVANYGVETNDLGYIIVGSTGVYADELVDIIVLKYQGTNQVPYEPNNPSPVDGAIAVPIDTDLSWTGGDPDNDTVTYDLYFGTNPTPEKIAEGLTETTFELPEPLTYETTYYWMIHATDTFGASTDGPIWSFTTQDTLPALEIGTITGTTIVTAIIKNNGTGIATNITWGIYITGGLFGLMRKSFGGIISSIDPGSEASVTSKLFIGFGKIKVNVFASCDQIMTPIGKTVYGTMFLIWIRI